MNARARYRQIAHGNAKSIHVETERLTLTLASDARPNFVYIV